MATPRLQTTLYRVVFAYAHVYNFSSFLSVFVDWGDGQTTVGRLDDFGPYQKLHQYAAYDCTYGVTVYYCSNPAPYYPSQRCCDCMYRTIDVTYDPDAIG